MEKSSKGYREYASAGSSRKAVQKELSYSRKMVITIWCKALISCSESHLTRRVKQRDRSPYPYKETRQSDVEAHHCAIHHGEASQISLAKVSTKDICEATPSTFDEIEGLPLESAITLRLYNPMPYDDSIRLLRIAKGVLSDPAEVTLEFARLDGTTPAYEALSYVWGSSAQVSQIVHQSTQTAIFITRNLHDALKGVRDSDQDRVIWVDALCINQEDVTQMLLSVLSARLQIPKAHQLTTQ